MCILGSKACARCLWGCLMVLLLFVLISVGLGPPAWRVGKSCLPVLRMRMFFGGARKSVTCAEHERSFWADRKPTA